MQNNGTVTENSNLSLENSKTQFTAKVNKPHHQVIWNALADYRKKKNNPDLSQTEFLVFLAELYGNQEALTSASLISEENQRLITTISELRSELLEEKSNHEELQRVREETVQANEQLSAESQTWKSKYESLSTGSEQLIETNENLKSEIENLKLVALEYAETHPKAAEYLKTLEWMHRVIEHTGKPYTEEDSPMAVFHAMVLQFRKQFDGKPDHLKYFLFQ